MGVKAAVEVLGSRLWSSPLLPSDFGKSREIGYVENVRVRRYQELCPLILQKLWFHERLTRGGGFKAPSPSCVGASEGWLSRRERKQGLRTAAHPVSSFLRGWGGKKGAWLGHYPLPTGHRLWEKIRSRQVVNNKALFLDRVDDESASVYENLNIKSPKVSGMSNTGR